MANTNLSVVSPDFDTNLQNLKNYLQGQTQFQDYDFNGSNLSVLLGILAYNTYMNAFGTNQAFNEAFLDSCQLLDSAISKAKELNYLPRSYTSSVAYVNIQVFPQDNPTTINIPKGTSFTSKVDNTVYTFSTRDPIILANTGNGFQVSNVAIYEGIATTDAFQYQAANTNQRFVLSNRTIDTDSLQVTVQTSNNSIEYAFADTLLGLLSNSNVYFLQGAAGGSYEVLFGNGIIGNAPPDQSIILARYATTSGSDPNGANLFSPANTVGGYANVVIQTVSPAAGGSPSETLASIKFNAPRHYQTQGRAISTNDYKILLKQQFPAISALHVFGGEDMDPPQYGSVVVSVELEGLNALSATWKNKIAAFLQDKMTLGMVPVIIDPNYLYAKVVIDVNYNVNLTSSSPSAIAALVSGAVESYANTYLDDFNVTLFHSRLGTAIDNADPSIVNNNLSLYVAQKLVPTLGASQNFNFSYENALVPGSLQSTPFVANTSATVFLTDDGKGSINLSTLDSSNNVVTVQSGLGSIDYTSGDGSLTGLVVSSYTGLTLDLVATPSNPDVSVYKNNILKIIPTDIVVNATAVRQ